MSSTVVLRNLTINGLGTASAGIAVTGSAAETHIENCIIQNFATYGVFTFLNVRVTDTTIRKTGTGIWVDNAGGPVAATIVNCYIKQMDGGDPNSPGTGIFSFRNATVTVRNTVVIRATNSGFRVSFGKLNLESCTATENDTGITSDSTGIARLSNNFVTANGTGLNNLGTIETWSNNKVRGNAIELAGSPLTTVTQQ